MRSRNLVTAAILAAAAVALYVGWLRPEPRAATRQARSELSRPSRPMRPPVPGQDVPQRAPEPGMPPGVAEAHRKAYDEATRAGDERPGEKAFRATVDGFMEYNKSFAEAQARDEGLSLGEVRELTYFGFLVLQTQRWSEVEDLIGRELSEDERMAGEDLMHRANGEFKDAMRTLVKDGASEAARWEIIRTSQQRYLTEYFALTGMTPDLLDDFLAGDITRTGAPIATPPPEDMPAGPEYTPPAPRPERDPR